MNIESNHHHHTDHCCCNHEHHHEHHHAEKHTPETTCPKHLYLLKNLGCANCAAKMEKRINELPSIEYAAITFTTRQLCVAAKHPEELLPDIQAICSSIESEVIVTPLKKRPAVGTHDHDHKEHKDPHRDLICIVVGAIFFVAGLLTENLLPILSVCCFVLSYLILGLEILWSAVKNLKNGNLFDENFLMGIATIGAFAIAQYEEAVGVMLFYRVGEWFEHKAVARSRSQIMEALDLRPETVQLLTDNTLRTIPAEEAAVGDILLVRPGDRIPLDGVVTEGESHIDTSPITGEPVPVTVSVGSPVTSGCLNTSGLLHIRVEKLLEESIVSRILDSVENAAASKPKIDRFITRFSRIYTPIVVVLALCTAILPSLFTGNWEKWIYTALTFLVISCPCALVLSVPLAFFSGIGAASKQKILLKGGSSIEALKNIKSVVMDKTGTITKGNFVLQQIAGTLSEDKLLSLAASCESASTHPIGISILQAAGKRGLTWETPSELSELSGRGIKAILQKRTLLCGNAKLLEEQGISVVDYHLPGYGTQILLALDGLHIGTLIISDTIKEDAVSAIGKLKHQKITTAILTGDSLTNARSVAEQVGIAEANVHAQLLPDEKVHQLQKIRQSHGSVMFVGDGINDAPVLAGADVGAAMGSGADAAIEAADVVFMTSDMEAIPESIRIAKTTGRIAMQNVGFALVIKAAVMVLGLMGYASMWFAVFADSGVAMLCVLNSIRILYERKMR